MIFQAFFFFWAMQGGFGFGNLRNPDFSFLMN